MKYTITISVLFTLALCAFGQSGADAGGDLESPRNDSSHESTMVHWLAPPAAKPPVRTEEEKEAGRNNGRPTPEPEFLQPPIDTSLLPFAARYDRSLQGSFKGTASDILPGLVRMWIAAFNEHYPQVDIELTGPYAGSLGMLDVIKGSYDYVFVSRELKPTDISSFNDKYGYDPYTVPISGAAWRHYGFLDAIGFFVHPENPIEKLTFEQLDSLYSTTRHRGGQAITTWGQLGLTGDWAEKRVSLHGIKPWNGFEEFVRQRVLSMGGLRGEWREDIDFHKLAFPVAEAVTADRYGIGYTGLAYLGSSVKVLPLSSTGSDGPYIPPGYEQVAKAEYPLSRMMYFNTNKAPGKSLPLAMEEFLRFIVSREGQEIVLEHAIYLPLRGHQQIQSIAFIDAD